MPESDVLQFTTMCGHSLVAQNLVRTVIEKVKSGKLTPEEGALILAKPCTCGIFNTKRCAALIKEKLETETSA